MMKEWTFHRFRYGLGNVILDGEERHLASHVPARKGALMAKAPAMLNALNEIAALDPGPTGDIARKALASVAEAVAAASAKATD